MKTIAIYSRKSLLTDIGSSIENQIQLCKNYCSTYIEENDLNFLIYEDEGFSGKNTNRPRFKQLINDIKRKKIDILICYRLDRISRNVSDFSSTLELLQKFNVTFISLKEQFDTSTPMGRAMIYIASVFAQLERETIAERVKDNMIELAKMGKWSGGQLPIGYTSKKITYKNKKMNDKKFSILVPVEEELKIVKLIYDTFLENNSMQNLLRLLHEKQFKSKNGAEFELSVIKRILKNTLYVKSNLEVHEYLKNKGLNVFGEPNGNGYLTYNKYHHDKSKWIIAVANHQGMISPDKWLKVQHILEKNKSTYTSNRCGTSINNALFSGLLKCKTCGLAMHIKYNRQNKDGQNYVYYTCNSKANKCSCPALRTDIIDNKLLAKINIYDKDTFAHIFNKKLKELSVKTNNNIDADILQKEKQAHNLIIQLSNTKNVHTSEMIMKEIDKLNEEIQSLKNTSTTKNSLNNESPPDISNIVFYIKNFKYYINRLDDKKTKRMIIKLLIKEIIYDYDNKNFEIKYL